MHVRYEGTDSALVVPFGGLAEIQSAFEDAYRQRFAFLMKERAWSSKRCRSKPWARATRRPSRAMRRRRRRARRSPRRCRSSAAGAGGRRRSSCAKRRSPATCIDGPAIIAEKNATTVVEPGWRARVTDLDHLVLERVQPREARKAIGTTVDPVMLEVFNNLFMNIAEQMGLQLQNTAYSVNIKERLDFVCALFDADGNLIANAPHMPVHLGSMSESIKTVIARNAGRMQPGDVYVLNDPYHGGTHLPDVTVVTPGVRRGRCRREACLFYVGSRGHHADIGGITPGSMPPFSTRIEEEGVQIDNFKLVERGRAARCRRCSTLLRSGPHPSRNPEQNLADLKAQIAANEKGVQELRKMVAQFGLDVVQAYMRHVQDNAEESVRRVISALKDGAVHAAAGQRRADPRRRSASTRARAAPRSTSPAPRRSSRTTSTRPRRCAWPRCCTCSARWSTTTSRSTPGCLKPLKVIMPEGSMLNPQPPASVVAGNVETSTCITNALYGALGVMAAGQCTMNNFTFGNERHQYYETISGGSGAGAGFDGTSVVQTHMTNSRLTDPEVLEFRFPVRLESYEIRTGLGRRRTASRRRRRRAARALPRAHDRVDPVATAARCRRSAWPAGSRVRSGINRVERADGRVRGARPHRLGADGAGRRVRDRNAGRRRLWNAR